MIQEDIRELDHLDHAAVARVKNFVKVQVRIHLSTFPVKQIFIKKFKRPTLLMKQSFDMCGSIILHNEMFFIKSEVAHIEPIIIEA